MGQSASIGWYVPKSFLWINNPNPQLVTLTVNDKTIISYQDTKNKVEKRRKSKTIFFIFLNTFMIGVCFMSCMSFLSVAYPQVVVILKWFFIKLGFKMKQE